MFSVPPVSDKCFASGNAGVETANIGFDNMRSVASAIVSEEYNRSIFGVGKTFGNNLGRYSIIRKMKFAFERKFFECFKRLCC